MIYLQFAVSRPHTTNSPALDGTAEFMAHSKDPCACARKAVALLRAEGWETVDVIDAREVVTIADFDGDEQLLALYRKTAGRPMAYQVHAHAAISKAG